MKPVEYTPIPEPSTSHQCLLLVLLVFFWASDGRDLGCLHLLRTADLDFSGNCLLNSEGGGDEAWLEGRSRAEQACGGWIAKLPLS